MADFETTLWSLAAFAAGAAETYGIYTLSLALLKKRKRDGIVLVSTMRQLINVVFVIALFLCIQSQPSAAKLRIPVLIAGALGMTFPNFILTKKLDEKIPAMAAEEEQAEGSAEPSNEEQAERSADQEKGEVN